MNVIETSLPGVLIIEPKVFGDERGFFLETFQAERYREIGIDYSFVQDNQSRSQGGVLRGLHLQKTHPQGKLISCYRGAVFDVVVDVNPTSNTFGQYVSVEINESNHKQVWIPPGYAHGFYVLTDVADFYYKCTDYYHPEDESGLIWNDPDVAINWPFDKPPQLSDKDQKLPTLQQIKAQSGK